MHIKALSFTLLCALILKEATAGMKAYFARIVDYSPTYINNSNSKISVQTRWLNPLNIVSLEVDVKRALPQSAIYQIDVYIVNTYIQRKRLAYSEDVTIFDHRDVNHHRLPECVKNMYRLGASETERLHICEDSGIYDFEPFIATEDLHQNHYFKIISNITNNGQAIFSWQVKALFEETYL